jgi:hypothetical protein
MTLRDKVSAFFDRKPDSVQSVPRGLKIQPSAYGVTAIAADGARYALRVHGDDVLPQYIRLTARRHVVRAAQKALKREALKRAAESAAS